MEDCIWLDASPATCTISFLETPHIISGSNRIPVAPSCSILKKRLVIRIPSELAGILLAGSVDKYNSCAPAYNDSRRGKNINPFFISLDGNVKNPLRSLFTFHFAATRHYTCL